MDSDGVGESDAVVIVPRWPYVTVCLRRMPRPDDVADIQDAFDAAFRLIRDEGHEQSVVVFAVPGWFQVQDMPLALAVVKHITSRHAFLERWVRGFAIALHVSDGTKALVNTLTRFIPGARPHELFSISYAPGDSWGPGMGGAAAAIEAWVASLPQCSATAVPADILAKIYD